MSFPGFWATDQPIFIHSPLHMHARLTFLVALTLLTWLACVHDHWWYKGKQPSWLQWAAPSELVLPDSTEVRLAQRSVPQLEKPPEARARFALDRLRYELDMIKDPNTGKVPDRIREIELTQAMRAPRFGATATRAAGLTTTPRGPGNLGGRTRALAFDVRDPQVMLSGGVSSGVFKTTNGGVSWTKVSANDEVHNVTAIAQDTRPGQEDTWYYATGESLGNSASLGAFYFGQGVYRSDDNGDTWTFLGNSNTGALETFDRRADLISRLVVDPGSGDVYAACLGEILRSTDGGATWAAVLADPAGTWSSSHLTDLIVTPSGRLYAAFAGSIPNGMDGVWTSTSGDPGTWTCLAGSSAGTSPAGWNAFGTYGRLVLNYAPSNENVLFVIYDNLVSSSCAGIAAAEAELFRMEFNGVSTWSFQNLSAFLPDETGCSDGNDPFAIQGGYDLCVAVKPNDQNEFYIGGTNAYAMTYTPAGPSVSFTRIGGYNSPADYALWPNHHPDIHVFAFKPNDPDTLFTGTDGGVHKTATAFTDWVSLNNDYVTYQEYHIAISPNLGSDLILGGAQDNGTHESANGTLHNTVLGGDGVAAAISSSGDYYLGFQRGPIYRYNSSVGFTSIRPSGSGASIFVTYFYLDPDNDEYLYYADGADLYRSTSASTANPFSWTLMTGIGTATTANIRALATTRGGGYSASDPTRKLYLGTQNGQVFVLDDPAFAGAGTVPTNITPPTAGLGIVSGIAVHPANDDEVLVTYSNYGIESAFHTLDGGANWTEVEGNIGLSSFRSSAIMEENGTVYYFVGTSTGLYCATALSGASTVWAQVSNSDIGYAVVSGLRLRPVDNVMAVGTHGNGMFMVEPPRTPAIAFVAASDTVTEAAVQSLACREFQDISVPLQILAPPTGDAIVTISTGGTATEGADYDLIGNPLTFPDGADDNQNVTLRVYDDTGDEPDETVILTFAIGGTTDAVAGTFNQTFTLTLVDNDDAIDNQRSLIWAEDWESGSFPDWNRTASPPVANRWLDFSFNGCTPIDNETAQIIFDDGATLFCGYSTTVASTSVRYRQVDATGLSDLRVAFDYLCPGEGTVAAPVDYGQVVYSTNGGITWIPVGDALVNTTSATSVTVSLPAVLDGTTFDLGWQWVNDANGAGSGIGLSLDNIEVTGGTPAVVEADLTVLTVEEYLGPFETATYYDAGELICQIENLSAHDFGCTTVAVDRNGTGAVNFWYAGAANDGRDLASKTVLVTPAVNAGNAPYRITLFYTQAEIQGWEAATGKSFANDLQMVKNPGPIANVTPATPNPNGLIVIDSVNIASALLGPSTSRGVTATFSDGFSGFGVGDPGANPAGPLPTLSLTLQAIAQPQGGVDVAWTTRQAENLGSFEVERSLDGEAFLSIGSVRARANAQGEADYRFHDPAAVSGQNFYRLQQVNLDGQRKPSQVVSVWVQVQKALKVYPTMFEEVLYLAGGKSGTEPQKATLRLYDTKGTLVLSAVMSLTAGEPKAIRTAHLSQGSYFYDLQDASGSRQVGKLLRR